MDIEANIQRGESLFMDGLLDEAETVFQEILHLSPDHYKALNNLGVIRFNRGMIEDAEELFLKALTTNGEYTDPLLNLADLYQATSQNEREAQCLEKILVHQSNDVAMLNRLAFLYLEAGNKDKAHSLLEASLDLLPNQVSIKKALQSFKYDSDSSFHKRTHRNNSTPVVNTGLPVNNKGKKMRFSICSIEPKGFNFAHFLYDMCKYLCLALESLGHDCCIVQNYLDPYRINIIVGSHRLNNRADAEQIINKAGSYILWQSEIVTGDSINNSNNQKSFIEVHLPLMRHAQAIWTNSESKNSLKKLGIESEILRLGYHPAMEEVIHKKHKDIDFLFYGSLTPHRHEMIEKLKLQNKNVVVVFDVAAIYRNDLIARTHVQLAPKQGNDMDQFTANRIIYLLNNRSTVVVERCRNQELYENCFPYAETDQWVELCMETLRRSDLNEVTDEYFDHFQKIRMTDLVLPLIERLR